MDGITLALVIYTGVGCTAAFLYWKENDKADSRNPLRLIVVAVAWWYYAWLGEV